MAFDVQKTNIEITATDKTGAAFNAVKSSLTGLTAQFGALGGLLGAGAFAAMTKRIIDQADSMNDLSKRTGLAVEQIGAWRLATEQSGTSMEALTSALGKGSKYLVQHGDDLKKIGINAKTSEELILQLSGIISKMPSDDPRRTALAMQVLGKSAGELIPLLSEGEAGLRGMLDRGRELNPVTADLAKNADIFNDNLAEMKMLSGGLFVNLVANILPSFNTYLKQLQMVVNDGDWMDKLLFFTVGYVPGKIANQTEKPEVQIQKYTQRIVELKKELADLSDGKFGYRKDGILKQIEEAEKGIAAQRQRSRGMISPKGRIGGGVSEEALDSFLKPDGGAPKKDAIAERIKALGVENTLLSQGVSIEDARTIARLKGDGATDKQIVKILNLTNAQTQYEEAEKKAEKTKQDLVKATQDHADAMQKMLETSDLAVLNAEREYEESQRNLQVMQLGETAVIRMESARLLEAAASAEQGLAYARLNGLSQENIDFTETQILRLKQLAEARLKFADSADANTAFEKDKERIKDLEKEKKDAAKRVADEQNRFYDQLGDNLGRALTEGLFDSFKKGESFGRAMLKNITAFGKTAIAQIFQGIATNGIKGIFGGGGGASVLGGLGSIFSGNASAGPVGGGFGGGLSGLSGIADIFQRGNSALVSSIESLGTFLSTGNGGLGDILGGALGQYAGTISNVLPFAGVALNLLQGNLKGALGAGIGAALSFTPLGPIGGLIGSVLGGSLFGKKKPRAKIFSSQAFSEFANGEVLSNANPAYASGKRFVELGAGTQLNALNESFSKSLSAILKGFGLSDSISTYSFVSQRKDKASGIFNATVNGVEAYKYSSIAQAGNAQQAFDKLMEDVLGQGIAKAIEKSELPASIKKFFEKLVKKEDVNEAINTLLSLKNQLRDLPRVFDGVRTAIDTTAFKTSIVDLQKQFNDTAVFTNLFYSAEENFATFTKQITRQLTDLNQVVPKTRDEYRALVDSFKVTDEASSKLFGGLVALAPAMDAYFKQLEAQRQQFAGLNSEFFSTSSDFLTGSALAGQGRDFTREIGEIGTVRRSADAETNAVVQTLVAAQAETRAVLEAVAQAVQETARIQKIWNGDGLPETRVI